MDFVHKVSKKLYQFKLWYGFKYLGYFKRLGYDYAHFKQGALESVWRSVEGKEHKMLEVYSQKDYFEVKPVLKFEK